MIYSNHDMTLTQISLLEDLEYLDEEYIMYNPIMVPIVHSVSTGLDLIKLEAVLDYVENTGINDAYEAINNICEANGVPIENIGFSVRETNLLENGGLARTAMFLKESGFQVNISPISSHSVYCTVLDEALELDAEYDTFEESYHLQNYVFNENFVTDTFNGIKNRVSKNWNNMKNAGNDTIKGISHKYAAIKKKIADNYTKLKTTTGKARDMIKKNINKLSDALSVMKDKAKAAKDSVSNTASNIKNKIGQSIGSVGNGVKKVGDHAITGISHVSNGIQSGTTWAKNKLSTKISNFKNR